MAPSVLIVENEPVLRMLLVEMLEESGLEVVAVASVAEAREILAFDAERFDVVVTDLLMPDESGLDLCRTLRSAHFPRPILAISGDRLQLDDAFEAGATGCLSKPFNIDELLRAIQLAVVCQAGHGNSYGAERSPLKPASHPA